ncbi:hypothetical protein ASE01_12150 [Nocardioides sp. Root190]|uniref:hypothetical protein n=1 Tax=Nocardioides sp. Root190 TaxID=1736488 RepID=UPI000701F30E|nr:hypothetical protein [Nocardioides sp. Root190]KRB75807.1 hypothetical protein ASE01_12150 [Nocardioides sp. Root190]
MDLPWGTLVTVATVWTIGIVAYSTAAAVVVARAAQRPMWVALVVGVLVPVIGPWAWAVIEYAKLKQHGYSGRGQAFVIRSTTAAVGWWIASVLLLTALFFPWLHVQATVEAYGGKADPTPLDTTVGGLVLAATALVSLTAGVVTGSAFQRRLSLLMGAVMMTWFLVCLSSLVVYNSLDAAASNVLLWSGQEVAGEIRGGAGLWLTLLASVAGIVGAAAAGASKVSVDQARQAGVAPSPVVGRDFSTGCGAPPLPSPQPGPSRDSTGGW